MREFLINRNDADQRLDKYLTKSLKRLPKSLMYKYIRNKKIKVNRKRCEISQRLNEGDLIQMYISEEFFEDQSDLSFMQASDQLDVIFENEHLLIVYKPANLLVHSDDADQSDTLMDRILKYLVKTKAYDPHGEKSFTPALCHRIDRNTEGLVIAAKSAEALRMMNEKIREREIEKHYLCIVEGQLRGSEKLVHYYRKDEQKNKAILSSVPKDDLSEVSLIYKSLAVKDKYSLLDINLLTGKSHQIRAQLSFIKHPLLNDIKYQGKPFRKLEGQALCAYKICFAFISDAGCLNDLKNKEIEVKEPSILKLFNQL